MFLSREEILVSCTSNSRQANSQRPGQEYWAVGLKDRLPGACISRQLALYRYTVCTTIPVILHKAPKVEIKNVIDRISLGWHSLSTSVCVNIFLVCLNQHINLNHTEISYKPSQCIYTNPPLYKCNVKSCLSKCLEKKGKHSGRHWCSAKILFICRIYEGIKGSDMDRSWGCLVA